MRNKAITDEGDRQHLTGISASELSAITFVRDYIQLHFDGPTINAYTLPTVVVGDSVFSHADSGYRDALCGRIGTMVLAAYAAPGQRLQIDFSDGCSLLISLKPADHVVEEAAVYFDPRRRNGRPGSDWATPTPIARLTPLQKRQ